MNIFIQKLFRLLVMRYASNIKSSFLFLSITFWWSLSWAQRLDRVWRLTNRTLSASACFLGPFSTKALLTGINTCMFISTRLGTQNGPDREFRSVETATVSSSKSRSLRKWKKKWNFVFCATVANPVGMSTAWNRIVGVPRIVKHHFTPFRDTRLDTLALTAWLVETSGVHPDAVTPAHISWKWQMLAFSWQFAAPNCCWVSVLRKTPAHIFKFKVVVSSSFSILDSAVYLWSQNIHGDLFEAYKYIFCNFHWKCAFLSYSHGLQNQVTREMSISWVLAMNNSLLFSDSKRLWILI